jgi:hypothetical protein
MADIIQIRSIAKRNILVSAITGCLTLIFGSLLLILLPVDYYLIGIFIISLSLVFLLIAWVKFREPTHSFLLSKKDIIYQSRHGRWRLAWDNVQRIDIPKVHQGMLNVSIEMVGIKLKRYPEFLSDVSPRLMTNLLMEQRPLLFHQLSENNSQSCSTGQCATDGLIEDDSFKDEQGQLFRGIQAMFANRMTRLRSTLGYDLYIAVSDLDRPKEEFVNLLRQCQQRVIVENEVD